MQGADTAPLKAFFIVLRITKMRTKYLLKFNLALLLIGLGCTTPNEFQPPPPPSVTVAKPIVQDVTIFLEENGQTEAADRAEVRARIQGFLEQMKFRPGSEVKEKDVLYVIEQRQYLATLDSAKASFLGAKAAYFAAKAEVEVANASLNSANADLNVKELDLKRADELLPSGAITQSEYDNMKAQRDSAIATRDAAKASQMLTASQVEQAKAEVKKAEANVQQAEINVDYTEVKAPIAGRITRTDVTRGNLVQNGTLLATVVSKDTIWANFSVSERDFLALQRADEKPADFDVTSVKVFLQRAGDEGYPYEGYMDYVDPEVDQGTGTLGIRAVFKQSEDTPLLVPGLFVRVRVPIATLKDAVLVPEVAVGRDQVGPYVMIVNSENTVERRNVELGNKESDMIVVRKGLTPDDSVIVVGLQRARPGAKVAPKQTTLEMQEEPEITEAAEDSTENADSE